VVDAIEPCLAFWTDQLGFEITGTVPHEDSIGFAMMQKGGVELMYQNRASIDTDLGASEAHSGLGEELTTGTMTLFIEIEDLDSVIESLVEPEVVVPRRQTFYGMDELFVRAPCGTLVGFAAKIAGAEDERFEWMSPVSRAARNCSSGPRLARNRTDRPQLE
jgi:uncharacterized glyoxalase superfamily protein PhnB